MRILVLLLATYGICIPTPSSVSTALNATTAVPSTSSSSLPEPVVTGQVGFEAKTREVVEKLGLDPKSDKAQQVIENIDLLPGTLLQELSSNLLIELVKISQVEPGIWKAVKDFHYWKFLPAPQTEVEWYHAKTKLPINVQVEFLSRATDSKALISPTRMLDAVWQYEPPVKLFEKSGSELYDLLQPYVKLAIKKGMSMIDDLSAIPVHKLDALEQVPKTVLESVRFSSHLQKFKDEPKEMLPELLMTQMLKYVKSNMKKNRTDQADEFISLVKQQPQIEVPVPYMLYGFSNLLDDQVKATVGETLEMMKPYALFMYQHDFTMSYLGYLIDSVSLENLNEIKKLPEFLIQTFLVHGLTVRGWDSGWSQVDLDKYLEKAAEVVSSVRFMHPAVVPEYLEIATQSNKKDWDVTMLDALNNVPADIYRRKPANVLYDLINPAAELVTYLGWPMAKIEDISRIPTEDFQLLKLVPKEHLNVVPVFRWPELAESASKQPSPEKAVKELFKLKAEELVSK